MFALLNSRPLNRNQHRLGNIDIVFYIARSGRISISHEAGRERGGEGKGGEPHGELGNRAQLSIPPKSMIGSLHKMLLSYINQSDFYVSAFTVVAVTRGHGRYRSPHIHQDLAIVLAVNAIYVTTSNLINAGLCVRLNTANCSHWSNWWYTLWIFEYVTNDEMPILIGGWGVTGWPSGLQNKLPA